MWRGVTRWKPMLSGRQHGAGGMAVARQMVIYPIRCAGEDGLQLVNWSGRNRDSGLPQARLEPAGSLDDFIGAFADWHFDWLDVPAFIRAADSVLEFPMVDQDPLPALEFWTGNAARRCRPSDGAARLQRCRSGDPGMRAR